MQTKAAAALQSQQNLQMSSAGHGGNYFFYVSSANHYLFIHSYYAMLSQLHPGGQLSLLMS